MPGPTVALRADLDALPPGGAQELVAAGVTEGVDVVVGAHLMSTCDTGQVVALPGLGDPHRGWHRQ